MRKDDVLKHYDNNAAAAGRAVGCTRSAVQQWEEIIPELWAYRYERVTDGALKVDPNDYPINPSVAKSA